MNIDKYGVLRIEPISNQENPWFQKYEKFIAFLNKESKILEIGPWNGGFSLYVKEKQELININIHLLDISSSTIELLKKQTETQSFQIHLKDSIEFLSEKKVDKYDLIVMRHVLEHMDKEYISKLIPLLVENLSETWSILIEVPNIGNFPYGFYYSFFDFTHVTYFTFESLAEAFLLNTNSELKIETYNLHFPLEFTGKSIIGILKEIIAKIFIHWSTIFTFLIMKIHGDRIGSWQVYSPFIFCRIKHKNHE